MSLLDLVFPPRCGGCGASGTPWCGRCSASVRPFAATQLRGIPLVAGGRLEGPLQQAIHTYKYRPRPALAAALSVPLRRAMAEAGVTVKAMSFVPLHPTRQRQRGFNQAERLARQLAADLDVPLIGCLTRVRVTPAQVGLSETERRVNVAGAFACHSPLPQGLGLVDDVCTTGATLEAAAEAIVAAGGSVQAFLVLAMAAGHGPLGHPGAPQTFPAPVVTFPGQSACPNLFLGDLL